MRKILIFAGIGLLLGIAAVLVARRIIPVISPRPDNLGVKDGALAPCPPLPNCVTSRPTDAQQAIDPMPYTGTTAEAHARLLNILQQMPGLSIVENRPNYIWAESRTPFWGFIDDNEFYFDDSIKVIEVRAAARLGRGDLGTNRDRIEKIRASFESAGQ